MSKRIKPVEESEAGLVEPAPPNIEEVCCCAGPPNTLPPAWVVLIPNVLWVGWVIGPPNILDCCGCVVVVVVAPNKLPVLEGCDVLEPNTFEACVVVVEPNTLCGCVMAALNVVPEDWLNPPNVGFVPPNTALDPDTRKKHFYHRLTDVRVTLISKFFRLFSFNTSFFLFFFFLFVCLV